MPGVRGEGSGFRVQGPAFNLQSAIFNLQFAICNLQSTPQKKPREPRGPRGFWSSVGYASSLQTTSDPATTGAKVKPEISGQARTHTHLIVVGRGKPPPFPRIVVHNQEKGKRKTGATPTSRSPEPEGNVEKSHSPPRRVPFAEATLRPPVQSCQRHRSDTGQPETARPACSESVV